MRIHWAIIVLAVIGTILLTWHIRTKDFDFMSPQGITLPPEDDGSDLAVGAAVLQPKIEKNPRVAEVLGNPEESEEPEIPEISDLDLGDLDSSPGLDSYRDFAQNNPPDRLFELSSTLRARGQFQRALLAFERVIDTSKADSKALDEASKGISTLSPTLPRWNIDSTNEIPLTLHLGTTRLADDSLKAAALEVATIIRKSSGDQLEIMPKITSSGSKEATADGPVALWISTGGKDPTSSAVLTLRMADDKTTALTEISLAVFQAVRGHLGKLGYPLPPPLQANSRELLSIHITRLMWRDFARSLHAQRDATEAEEETTEN
ncbi:MAG: hypothetical protein OSB05_01640 [Akkermansiaceae bacterium]|nr:hypothetical protein [Akkermansiaceae bacterium]